MSWRDTITKEENAPTGWRATIQPDERKIGVLESGAAGVAQGGTFGFADELAGLYAGILASPNQGGFLGVPASDFSQAAQMTPEQVNEQKLAETQEARDAYTQARDQSREYFDKAKEANPTANFVGEMGGAIGSSLATGALGIVGRGAQAARSATAGRLIGAGAAEGALYGVGASEAGSAGDLAKDALIGAGIGALGSGVGVGVGKAGGAIARRATGKADEPISEAVAAYVEDKARAVGRGGKAAVRKTVSGVGGVDEKHITDYLTRPEMVRGARQVDELAADVVGNVDILKQKVIVGSRRAVDLLDDSVVVPKTELLSALDQIRQPLKSGITDDAVSAAKEIDRIYERLASGGPELSPTQLKKFIKELDQSINVSDAAGSFASPAHVSKVQFRKHLDQVLKESSEPYRLAMQDVAADAAALAAGRKQFGRLDSTASRLKSLGNRPQDKQEVAQALSGLDARLGTSLMEENTARTTQRAFEQDMTGGRGPRNRIVGGMIGLAVGGPPGAIAGAVAGHGLDRHGGQMTRGVLDAYLSSTKRPSAVAIGEMIKSSPERLGQFAGVLTEAAERGQTALGASHFILWQNDPEYRQMWERGLVTVLDQ